MFFIPGWLIAAVTFPGIIIHEAGHLLFCRLRKVAVLEVCYLRLANPPGYVIHERVENFQSSFLISVGPFILNSVLCFVLCLPALFPIHVFHVDDPLSYLLMYLGIAIGMHAFPSTGDAQGLWAEAQVAAKKGSLLAIASYPIVGLIYVANILRFFWFDAIYGMAVGVGLPLWILNAIK
jgi:hypothetical protein